MSKVLQLVRPGLQAAFLTRAFHCSPSHSSLEFRPCPPEHHTTDDKNRPIVVLFGWLLAKSRHLEKYGSIYQQNHGADIMMVRLEVSEILRPKKAEKTAIKVLERLTSVESEERPLLFHGFSVGGYLYSHVLNQITNNNKYRPVKERIIGQVFDSPVDFLGIPHGVSNAATKNPALRYLIKSGIETYLRTTAKYTTKVYLERSHLFFNNPVNSPSLFLFSKSDEVSDAARINEVTHNWKNNGISVTAKCWDTSPHVSHFYVHTKEYVDTVNNFVQKVMEPTPQIV